MRPVERIRLPHLVGVRLGEGQAHLVFTRGVGFEQLVLFDDPAEGVRRDLRPCERVLLDAQPVKRGQGGRPAVGLGKDFADRLQHVLQRHLADLAPVGAGLVFHHGHAVLLVTGEPRLDGAPGELARVAILISEGEEADRLDARLDGFALGHVNGSEHAHLQIGSGVSHEG